MPPATRTAALLGLPVLAVHASGLSGSFQFDDFNVIVDNPVVHSLAAWSADLGHGIRPLLKLTYAANWIAWPDAAGFRLINIGIHLVNTLLVYALARLVLRGYGDPAARGAPEAALWAALLFALHPAQTEAVTYVSGRSASLMATFYLGGMAAYVAGSLSSRRPLTHLASPLLFGLALATKETAISFPLALVLWEASRGALRPWRQAARRMWAHGIVLLVAIVLLVSHPVYGPRLIPDLDRRALYDNLLTQIDAITYLVARLFTVYPLNIDPDLRVVTSWSPALALEALLLLGLLALGAVALRRRPWWGFGILWFFLQLAPTNSLLPRLDLANDRQLYLASVGVFVAAGAEIELLRERFASGRRWVRPVLAAALVVLAAFTVRRNLDYATEIRLWEQTTQVSPRKPRAFNNLGYAYSAAGCLAEAEAAYRKALALNPQYAVARDNLASLRERAQPDSRRRAVSCTATGLRLTP